MTRPSAEARLRRLLAIVPWVVAEESPSVADVCRRFDITEKELIADIELLQFCGVHPFTPDALIEVSLEGGRVRIHYADWFRRPLRLTPEEALALVAGGSALVSLPGADSEGPLARALGKLAAALGVELSDAAVELGDVAAPVRELLQAATAEHRQVEIDYYSFGRDEWSTRIIEPHALYATEGEWYLAAWCRRAAAPRRFRVDRIRQAALLEERFEPPAAPLDLTAFEGRPEHQRVVIDLAPAARWVAEQYPVEHVEELGDGRLRVVLAASGRAWLERLLLRLGPNAERVEGADGVAAAAAGRVLARYDRR